MTDRQTITVERRQTEGLVDRQVCLDDEHWSTNHLALLDHVTSSSVENTVDATNSRLGTLQ